uniref:Uncharacterized protein n=1 Tax=Helicotheca tamesis TaxID=374047 RepID=A0A7S2IEY7_9STRA
MMFHALMSRCDRVQHRAMCYRSIGVLRYLLSSSEGRLDVSRTHTYVRTTGRPPSTRTYVRTYVEIKSSNLVGTIAADWRSYLQQHVHFSNQNHQQKPAEERSSATLTELLLLLHQTNNNQTLSSYVPYTPSSRVRSPHFISTSTVDEASTQTSWHMPALLFLLIFIGGGVTNAIFEDPSLVTDWVGAKE